MLELLASSLVNSCTSELSMRYKKTQAQQENVNLFSEMYNYYSNIAITRYDWKNLPRGVSERLLNIGLYTYGSVAFFEHDTLGLTALPCSANQYNILYEPTEVTVFGYGYSRQLQDLSTFGFIRSSPSGVPLAISVYDYVKRMCDILRSIDVIAQRMKRPYVFICDEKQRLTYQNLFKNIKDNEEIILGLKDFPLDKAHIDIAPLPSTQGLDKLWESYQRYEGLLSARLGINNIDNSKRERLLQDEVNANNMNIEMSNEVNIKQLTLDIQQVNKKFNTDIKVEVKELADFGYKNSYNYDIEGGNNNG